MSATRTRLICSLAFGVVSVPAAWASNSMSPFSLGTLDAVVGFCSQVNPAGGNAYRHLSATLTDGLNDRALDQMRHSADYGSAYSQFSAALSDSLPRADARAACVQIASGDTSHGPFPGHDGHDDHDGHDGHDGHGDRDHHG